MVQITIAVQSKKEARRLTEKHVKILKRNKKLPRLNDLKGSFMECQLAVKKQRKNQPRPCLDVIQIPSFFTLSITLIFSRLYGALNIGKKKLITQFSWKSRDESFELSLSTIRQYLPNKTKMLLFIGLKFFQSKQGLGLD